MRKSVYAVILSILIALLSLVCMIPPASASTKQGTIASIESAPSTRIGISGLYPSDRQGQGQDFAGHTYSQGHLDARGHNQNNSGNVGYNRGYNLDLGDNGGNLITTRGFPRGSQRNTQYFHGTSYSWDTIHAEGYNQSNTGNPGYNEGYNDDHGGNAGNQIVN